MEDEVHGEVRKKRRRHNTTTPELTAVRNEMYSRYILPYQHMIYCWIKKHANNHDEVDDYYAEMLRDFYIYIDTYDPKKNIMVWITTAMKRKIAYLNKRTKKQTEDKWKLNEHFVSRTIPMTGNHITDMTFEDLREHVGDDVLAALEELDPACRRAFLLRAAGYVPREIAQMEHEAGNLPSGNAETIRTRIHTARAYLQKNLTRDGHRQTETTDTGDGGETGGMRRDTPAEGR